MCVEHVYVADNSSTASEVNISSKSAPTDASSVLPAENSSSPSNAETAPSKPPVAKFRKRTSTGNCSVVQSSSGLDSTDGIASDVAQAISPVNPGTLNSLYRPLLN
jgi:hypothetical protein